MGVQKATAYALINLLCNSTAFEPINKSEESEDEQKLNN